MAAFGKRWRLARAVLGVGLLIAAGVACAAAVTVTDDRGRVVSLAQAPQRVVSLLPSLTESVCALGQCARLVGVDKFSNWPLSVRALPRLGGLDDAPLEAIVALKPDLVLLAESARITPRLESLGIKVMALEPRKLADVQRVLAVLGRVFQTDTADKVWQSLDAGLSQAAAGLPAQARASRVYFEVSREPYAASEASFIGELLARVGLRNIVPGTLGPFPLLNPEFVVRADPDIVMVADTGAAELRQRPGWSQMQALRNKRLCTFSREQGDMLVRPGPRLAQAALLLVRCVREQSPP